MATEEEARREISFMKNGKSDVDGLPSEFVKSEGGTAVECLWSLLCCVNVYQMVRWKW